MLAMPDDFAAAVEELRAVLAPDSQPEVFNDFVDLVDRLPLASKRQLSKSVRKNALAAMGVATIHYQIGPCHERGT